MVVAVVAEDEVVVEVVVVVVAAAVVIGRRRSLDFWGVRGLRISQPQHSPHYRFGFRVSGLGFGLRFAEDERLCDPIHQT